VALQIRRFRYLSGEKVFFWTFGLRPTFISQSKFVTKKQTNTTRGYCWGPSSFEGPQKHNLTIIYLHILKYCRSFGIRCFFRQQLKNGMYGSFMHHKEIYYINMHTNCLQVSLAKLETMFNDIKLVKIKVLVFLQDLLSSFI
jgi:hypothetical protein